MHCHQKKEQNHKSNDKTVFFWYFETISFNDENVLYFIYFYEMYVMNRLRLM